VLKFAILIASSVLVILFGVGSSAVPSLPTPPAQTEAMSLVSLPVSIFASHLPTSVVEEEAELPCLKPYRGNGMEGFVDNLGRLQGEWEFVYEDQTRIISSYVDSEAQGMKYFFRPDGSKKCESLMVLGERGGIFRKYDRNGMLELEGQYSPETYDKVGIWRWYTENGRLFMVKDYDCDGAVTYLDLDTQ